MLRNVYFILTRRTYFITDTLIYKYHIFSANVGRFASRPKSLLKVQHQGPEMSQQPSASSLL